MSGIIKISLFHKSNLLSDQDNVTVSFLFHEFPPNPHLDFLSFCNATGDEELYARSEENRTENT